MAKQFNEWLDEFINNGFDSKDVTNWPEEGSEPVVVEELPEDPQFGKVYAIETSGETTYYTTDVNGDWINLTEGGQGGGIIEVEYLPTEAGTAEVNDVYRVTVGTEATPAGVYICTALAPMNNIPCFVRTDNLRIPYGAPTLGTALELKENYAEQSSHNLFVDINPGGGHDDWFFKYSYDSVGDAENILTVLYRNFNSSDQHGAFYLDSTKHFVKVPNENSILIPRHSSNTIYYEEGLASNNMADILTQIYGDSDGAFTSGMVYYPRSVASSGQEYYQSNRAFMALIAPQAHSDGKGWIPDDYDWDRYYMQPGTSYQIVESSGTYSLQQGGGASYFTSEQDACDALQDSISHEVSSGEVFDSIYYPTISSGRFYSVAENNKNGIWLCTNTNETGISVDGDVTYGYYGYPLGFSGNTQNIPDWAICDFLTTAKTDKSYFNHISDVTFWNRANRIFYPIDSSGTKYTSQGWTNSVANVILYHNNECNTTQFTSGQIAYMEFYSSGQYAQLNVIDLPTTSTPVTVTINDVTYTITKNE